jgi:hypothetical protein
MKLHFTSEEDARATVEPVLRAWEIATDLTQARGSMRFELAGSYMVDRMGQKGSVAKGHVKLTMVGAPSVAKSTIYSKYPGPPIEPLPGDCRFAKYFRAILPVHGWR